MTVDIKDTTDANGVFNLIRNCKKTVYVMTNLGKLLVTIPQNADNWLSDDNIRYCIASQDYDSITLLECRFNGGK